MMNQVAVALAPYLPRMACLRNDVNEYPNLAQHITCQNALNMLNNAQLDQLIMLLTNNSRNGNVEILYKAPIRHVHVRHPFSIYSVPAEQALLIMAGAHDCARAFTYILFNLDQEDAIREACKAIKEKPFIGRLSLRRAVKTAAGMGVDAQDPDQPLHDAGTYLYRAHQAIAVYLDGLDELSRANASMAAEAVFRVIPLGNNPDDNLFAGIAAGLCLAGVMRYGKNVLERGKHNEDRFALILTAFGLALGYIPFAGPAVSGVIGLLAPAIAREAFRTKDISEQVVRIGAGIEDRVRASRALFPDWEEFNIQMEKTMRHCGFPY